MVEAKEGIVADAAEMAVVRRALLSPARTTVREVSLTELSMSSTIRVSFRTFMTRSIHFPER